MSASSRGARTSWTARTTTAIDTRSCRSSSSPRANRRRGLALACATAATAFAFASAEVSAQDGPGTKTSDVRAQTRLFRRGSTAVTETQASELTLTLTEAAVRPIQTWIRTAGALDDTRRILTTSLRSPEAELVQIGQRLRAFSVLSRTQMYQGKITRITPQPGGARVEATLAASARNDVARYLMEIVVERGPFLSVPNVSIIEEGGSRVVYLKLASGEYSPRTIHTGLEGELYTQVVDGLNEGDQVVSIGSFFVDADNKLKSGEAEEP